MARRAAGAADAAPKPTGLNLRELADQYIATVRLATAQTNRKSAAKRGVDPHSSARDPIQGSEYAKQLALARLALEREMRDALVGHPTYEWAMGVPGLKFVTLCAIVGLIPMREDNFTCFSNLRSFAGYAPGKDRKVKKQKLTFSMRLKTRLYIAIESIFKAGAVNMTKGKPDERPDNYYLNIYRNWRVKYAHRFGVGTVGRTWLEKNGQDPNAFEKYKDWEMREVKKRPKPGEFVEREDDDDEENPEETVVDADGKPKKMKKMPVYPDARQHAMARRKAIDVFLCNLWQVWRDAKGWERRELFVHEQLGHHMRFTPTEFSSPAISAKKRKSVSRGNFAIDDPKDADAADETPDGDSGEE